MRIVDLLPKEIIRGVHHSREGHLTLAGCSDHVRFVVVAAINWTIAWWLTRGLPRQFPVMNENSRCTILFHLLVPGGK